MNTDKTAIITTVANFELYKKTSKLFPKVDKKYIIDGTNGMYGIHSIMFMFKKLKNQNIDWLIMADEDVVFKNTTLIESILKHMKTNNYIICGVRDGGCISHRVYNPFAINTFFSVMNFKKITKVWNKKRMLSNQFIRDKEFQLSDKNLKYQYDVKSLYEPYYCFYFWLKRLGHKILYLETKMLEDTISNSVLFENEELLIHSWYARSYGVNSKQTKRIDSILKEVAFCESSYSNPIIYKDHFFKINNQLKKSIKKIRKKFR